MWPNPYTGWLSTPMPSGSHLLTTTPPPTPNPEPLPSGAKTTGAGKMQTTGWKMLVDSILVCCDWSVNNEGGSWTTCRADGTAGQQTPDTDLGGKRLRGTTRSLKRKWDSARLKLTVISQTVRERQRRTLRKASAQIFTQYKMETLVITF